MLNSLRDSIVFFNSPTDIADNKAAFGQRVRLGGMVKMGSLERGDNLLVRFEVTDGNKDIPVSYRGIVPDLFREGQGVIAEGHVEPGGTFTGRDRARQARRELHAARGRRYPEEAGTLARDRGARRHTSQGNRKVNREPSP